MSLRQLFIILTICSHSFSSIFFSLFILAFTYIPPLSANWFLTLMQIGLVARTPGRSTSGYYVYLGDNLISWSAKRQHTLSRSSAEVEYRGVANVVSESCWIINLVLELHCSVTTDTLVYCDNVSVVCLSSNPVQHQRTKHIETDIHFVREKVACGQVRVLHVSSRYKPLTSSPKDFRCNSLMIFVIVSTFVGLPF